jgi:NADP-dependent 3-hydroxy acid dehydrogenase YdfG
VLVVGASSGVGQAIATSASAAGAAVAVAARRIDRLEETVAACGEGAMSVRCDVRNPDDCVRAVEEAAAGLGGLDALVYAAGTTAFVDSGEATLDDWRLTMETNLIGFALTNAAALPLLEANQGNVVYLSSNSSRLFSPWKGLALYTASKLAAESLLRSLRLEHPAVAFTTHVVGPTVSEFGDDSDTIGNFAGDWVAKGTVKGERLAAAEHGQLVVTILAADRGTMVSEIVIEPRA